MSDNLNYTGWKKWFPTDDTWSVLATFQGDLKVSILKRDFPEVELPDTLENEYLLVCVKDDNREKLDRVYCRKGDHLLKVSRQSINFDGKIASKRTSITSRNDQQICAIDLLHDNTVTVKGLGGRWGSGKTLLLVTAGLEALDTNRFERIVWIRNNTDVANTKDLGALPGEVNDKLLPYLGPFIDHAGQAKVDCMLRNGKIVIEPLQSLRGRNFENTLIMCSEAENLTKEHLQLIIARAAEGSEVWLDFDIKQRDKKVFEESRGVEKMIDRLAGQELFGYVKLVECERSATAALADLLDD